MIQPEQTSLEAHQHIQRFLNGRPKLSEKELNAVLRLSQYLRVFGLLSATGYINQSNDQSNNKTRQQTVPVWTALLGQLYLADRAETEPLPPSPELMTAIKNLAQNDPTAYLALWRRSLIMANHWNFWAKAYKE